MTAPRTPRATHVVAVGLMLFSMFFGAGNLIFPSMLGAEAGPDLIPAITGFVITGVLLPVVAVIAVAISGSGVLDLASRAGRVFGVVFSVVAYLSIGSLYAMPRAASTAYTLSVETTLDLHGEWPRLLFSLVFFGVSLALVLVPGTVADSLGKYLTPALLVLIAVLVVVGFTRLHDPAVASSAKYADSPLVTGVLEGYFTMDSVAALAFAIVVVTSFGARGVTDHRTVVRATAVSTLIAGACLLLVYVSLAVLGTKMPDKTSFSDGAELLSRASELTLGDAGAWVFAAVVLLACLTTAVGLITASASFFHELLPRLSYRAWCVVFTVTGLAVANLGLQRILAVSGPVIGFIYPVAITLILLTVFHMTVGTLRIPVTYRAAVTVAVLFSLLDLGRSLGGLVIGWIPLFADGLGWLVPTLVAGAVGYAVDRRRSLHDEALVGGDVEVKA
ncbi:branched-chain amino acid transport system II carrier protein [Corynebacterium bovis]|uniref:branched-chain amino acid transport system II carrier protein n=1 Tax=Corynebacterium bovis TaxID=36808 RepID=UPI000F639370|nr:branched-chain amino acid transport system II carrier protein [Corynebacterium bovis]RRQ08077.1 branched-chain amino acid transport system II carrier protein [Corynebacterium bovis]RRQ11195.1 branched-chain amino acid transport system II carrier protein [Corynebacterium bovis]